MGVPVLPMRALSLSAAHPMRAKLNDWELITLVQGLPRGRTHTESRQENPADKISCELALFLIMQVNLPYRKSFIKLLFFTPLSLFNDTPSYVAPANFKRCRELRGHLARLLLVRPHVELHEAFAIRELRRERFQRLAPEHRETDKTDDHVDMAYIFLSCANTFFTGWKANPRLSPALFRWFSRG